MTKLKPWLPVVAGGLLVLCVFGWAQVRLSRRGQEIVRLQEKADRYDQACRTLRSEVQVALSLFASDDLPPAVRTFDQVFAEKALTTECTPSPAMLSDWTWRLAGMAQDEALDCRYNRTATCMVRALEYLQTALGLSLP